jgi:hypothetical protein
MDQPMLRLLIGENELKRQIHARLSEGRLGSIAGSVTKSQRGTGRPCVICRRTIEPAEVEREVSAGVCLHAHEACYKLWREESVACRAAAGPERGRERARRSSL